MRDEGIPHRFTGKRSSEPWDHEIFIPFFKIFWNSAIALYGCKAQRDMTWCPVISLMKSNEKTMCVARAIILDTSKHSARTADEVTELIEFGFEYVNARAVGGYA